MSLITSDAATMIPELLPYATPAKVFITGLKAARLQYQAIEILKEEQVLLERGKIMKEDISSSYNMDMLDSLFSLENEKTTDDIKFQLLKKIIIVGLTKDEKGRVQAQHFFKVISELSSTEILIIGACYHYSTVDLKWRGNNSARIPWNWRLDIATHSGLIYKEIVEASEPSLCEKKLLMEDTGGSNLNLGDYYRLTEYGYGLCKFAHEYDNLKT